MSAPPQRPADPGPSGLAHLPFARRRRRHDRTVEINVISLIDILFVLLIFFMVASSFSPDTAVEVDRPASSAATAHADEALAVALTRGGEVALADGAVAGDLVAALRAALARSGTTRAVVIADRLAATGRTLEVMDACRAAGARDVRLAATRAEAP